MPKKEKPSPKKRKGDYAKKVSGEIIEQIKRGTAPWQKPWKPGEVQHPENFATGKRYAGGNSLYLMSRQISEGRGDNRWGTYNQIREAGGQVKKGERGTRVLFFKERTPRRRGMKKGRSARTRTARRSIRMPVANGLFAGNTPCSMSSKRKG